MTSNIGEVVQLTNWAGKVSVGNINSQKSYLILKVPPIAFVSSLRFSPFGLGFNICPLFLISWDLSNVECFIFNDTKSNYSRQKK